MLIEKIAQADNRSKIIVILATGAIVALAAYDWGVSPQINYLQAAQQQDRMYSDSSSKAQAIRIENKKKERQVEKLTDEIRDAQTKFFTPEHYKEFFGSLEEELRRYGCSLDSLDFQNNTSSDASDGPAGDHIYVVTETAGISMTGQYGQIKNFLEMLQKLPQKITITDMSISPDDDNDKVLNCDIVDRTHILEHTETETHE